MDRLSPTSDFWSWQLRIRPTLKARAKKAEVTELDLLSTLLDDTLCGVYAIWVHSNKKGTLEEALVHLEDWFKSKLTSGEARKAFASRDWRAGESIEEYILELQRLARPLAIKESDRAFKLRLIDGLPISLQPFLRLTLGEKWPPMAELVLKIRTLGIQPQSVDDFAATTYQRTVGLQHTKNQRHPRSKCFNCGGFGHMASVCPSPKPRQMGPLLSVDYPGEGASCTAEVSISGMRVVGLVDRVPPGHLFLSTHEC